MIQYQLSTPLTLNIAKIRQEHYSKIKQALTCNFTRHTRRNDYLYKFGLIDPCFVFSCGPESRSMCLRVHLMEKKCSVKVCFQVIELLRFVYVEWYPVSKSSFGTLVHFTDKDLVSSELSLSDRLAAYYERQKWRILHNSIEANWHCWHLAIVGPWRSKLELGIHISCFHYCIIDTTKINIFIFLQNRQRSTLCTFLYTHYVPLNLFLYIVVCIFRIINNRYWCETKG